MTPSLERLLALPSAHETISYALPDANLVFRDHGGIIITIIIELTRSKTILENTTELDPQSVALYFKNLSQYSSRSR